MIKIAIGVLIALTLLTNLSATQGRVSPVKLKLTTTQTLCLGDSIKAQAEVINEGAENVVIDKSTIWHQISFTLFRKGESRVNANGTISGRNSGASKIMVGDSGSAHGAEFVVLRPGKSYRVSKTIKLDDRFFASSGGYELEISYGQFSGGSFEGVKIWKGTIKSNTTKFQIKNCRK